MCLANWLRSRYPGDLPMPCSSSKKQPLYKHANGFWTWSKADRQIALAISKSTPARFGIILKQLCVVDIDGENLVREMEEKFPCLHDAPLEKTPRGAHYYFERSSLADVGGFFDGPAQLLQGVDFKSVCSTGSGGFVVTAPTEGRQWVRAPWDGNRTLCAIPDSLLRAVARPRFLLRTLELRLGSTSVLVPPSGMSMLPVISEIAASWPPDPPGSALTVPLPPSFDERTVRGLADGFLQGSPVAPEFTYDDCLNAEDVLKRGWDTLRFADFLGLNRSRLALLESYVQEAVDNARINPILAASLSRVKLVDVRPNGELARPASLGSHAVFASHVRRAKTIGEEPVIGADPPGAVWARLPPVLQTLMCRYSERVMVAGGFVLSCLVADDEIPCSDIDVYIVTRSVNEANRIVQSFRRPGCVAHVTGSAVTITYACEEEDAASLPVQVILFLAPSARHVLENFDMEPCRVGAYVDRAGSLRVVSSGAWAESVLTRSFPLHARRWSTTTVVRALKMARKGFMPYIAGLDRTHAARHSDLVRASMLRRLGIPWGLFEQSSTKVGAMDLLVAERLVAGKRDPMGYLLRVHPSRSLSGYLECARPDSFNRILSAASYLGHIRRLWNAAGTPPAPKRKRGDEHVIPRHAISLPWRQLAAFGHSRVFFPSPMFRSKVVKPQRSLLRDL